MGEKINLRDYQREAVESVFSYWERAPSDDDKPASPLVVMPTGSGKSIVIGETVRIIAQEYGARVALITHRAELIQQDHQAIAKVFAANKCLVPVAVYSASLGSKRTAQVTICGVQSIARRPQALGHVDVLIVDEAHLISPKAQTQYGRVISALREINPDMRIVGFTATPYRVDQGSLTAGDDALFTSVCCNVQIKRLIDGGYLAPLVTGAVSREIDTSGLAVRMGEYAARDLELAFDVDAINRDVAADIEAALSAGRTSALLFGTSVAHATRLAHEVRWRGISCEIITGETTREQRDRIIRAFRAREISAIASCDVLTTGFDAPVTDVLAIVRATLSPSLYVQMAGRGMRVAEGKTDCALLDYGGNIARHGPVDEVEGRAKKKRSQDSAAPIKECPQCYAQCHAASSACIHCGYAFPPPEKKANREASSLPALSLQRPKEPPRTLEVGRVEYREHVKMASGSVTLRADYYAPGSDSDNNIWAGKIASEWICVEHEEDSFARKKAEKWWARYVGCRYPDSVRDAIAILEAGWAPRVTSIVIEKDGKFDRIIDRAIERRDKKIEEEADDIAQEEARENAAQMLADDEELPF